MKVSTTEPYQIIYSILQHQYLGVLFESFVVQLDQRGERTFLHQNISDKNVGEFSAGLDETDIELVRRIEEMQPDVVFRKFNTRKAGPVDFFLRIYDPEKGDTGVQRAIAGYLDQCKARILEKLAGRRIFIMSSDGDPTWKRVEWMSEKMKLRFYLIRNQENTHYFPTLLYDGQKLDFQHSGGLLLCDEPAWLLLDERLYHFADEVDGRKIRPFLTKKFIAIPRNVEPTYFRTFVAPLIAAYDVVAKGLEIRQESWPARPVLLLSEVIPAAGSSSRHLNEPKKTTSVGLSAANELIIELSFQYGAFSFAYDSLAHSAHVQLEEADGDAYIFHKIKRSLAFEKQRVRQLADRGLDLAQGRVVWEKNRAFDWLHTHLPELEKLGVELRQSGNNGRRYFLGYSTLELAVEEGRDWFDLRAKVRFGEFEIPFMQLRPYILRQQAEFPLPNGEIALIPAWWFVRYSELFTFTETSADNQALHLNKHHLALVQELERDSLATVVLSRKLQSLRDFACIEHYAPPLHFNGTLRPYQKAGYDWLRFLNQYRFGGCLADDMGLGKTVQTLALLQTQKEAGARAPSLLIMPTSLLHNWAREAQHFTPGLKTLIYAGTYRDKNTTTFDAFDLILTSYGIARLDAELLRSYRFHYLILDESQAIKNPASGVTKAVMKLQADHRLILTGTPLENSTMDLWSQMTFANPGLLGSQAFFRKEYQIPIEKKNDAAKTARLYELIKPFMLRRHKSQVATDLPAKIESIHYSSLSEAQQTCYEEAKSYYRNLIMQQLESAEKSSANLVVLQGLTRLRQLANHPAIVDDTYEEDSGKFDDVIHKMNTAIAEGHRVLIFSQFVRHLAIFRRYLDKNKISYAYLDGATRDRQQQVDNFQTDPTLKLFLISLKAGGVGLTLTAADYVFVLDPWWNPAVEAQAIDRAHRIGQEKTVFTYRFITRDTVEEKILALQQSKRRLADELIASEEGFFKSLSREDILGLLD